MASTIFFITGASAEVSGYRFSDFLSVRLWVLIEQDFGRCQHAWRAKPALNSTVLNKFGLEQVGLFRTTDPLCSHNIFAIGLYRQRQTGVDRFPA